MATPRMVNGIKAKFPQRVPDFDHYRLRHDTIPGRGPNGSAVAYSTDGAENYAPLRGSIGCVSRTGFPRREHEFDRDGRCFWCFAVQQN